jgi:Mn2+/Fe2+ NRAMP family transporter
MLWTMLFSFPLMAAIQEISARIGRVTGSGILRIGHKDLLQKRNRSEKDDVKFRRPAHKEMGKFTLPTFLKLVGYMATVVMLAAAIVLFTTIGK